MNTFQLEILSPEGQVFSGEVEEVSIPTETGEISILPHHADIYSKVAPGEVVIQRKGKTDYIVVLGGFVEVIDGSVSILSDYAVPAEKISVAQAKAAKERAEKLLQEKTSERDFSIIERELQKSILELDVAERARKRTRTN